MKFGELSKARIVIVDDEGSNMRLLQRMLIREGYSEVVGLTDPLDALAVCAENPPDLLLLDLRMPEIDGFEVLSRLQPVSDEHWLPVIVLSAERGGESRRRALEAGAHDYITKPFDREEAMLRIRNVLHTHILNRRLATANVGLSGTVDERTTELGQARLEILQRLAAAGEFRDDATGEHAGRVGRRAADLAQALHRSRAEVELIKHAATLHDIGKIAIPDAILLKPGELTEPEYEQMKAHTTIGAELLSGSGSPLLQMAEEIALTHHERWDGGGYPQGLSGEEIPISGRIVAVADTFDAITNKRPYRAAGELDDAITEIAAQRGRQFDPRVVDAFALRIGTIVRSTERERRNGLPPNGVLLAML